MSSSGPSRIDRVFAVILSHWTLRTLAWMLLVMITLSFVVYCALDLVDGRWFWAAVQFANLYFCSWRLMKRLWPN
jgi:hypothetical protein